MEGESIAIVEFSSTGNINMALTEVTSSNRGDITAGLPADVGGYTSIGSGMFSLKEGHCSLIFFTGL